MARSQFKNGDRSGAIKTLAEAKAAVPEDADAVIFAPRLVDVAGLYAELAERKPAKESLEAATLESCKLGRACVPRPSRFEEGGDRLQIAAMEDHRRAVDSVVDYFDVRKPQKSLCDGSDAMCGRGGCPK